MAIVKDEKDGVLTGGETKLGLVSDDIIPNKVCLIPELLKTLPYKPFACSAIDALVHATESFLSPHRKTMTSELFSEKAMDVILKGFKLIDEKGQDARFEYMDQFVTASFYAGIAFLKAGCGPVHGMSFPLGGTYHVPHGESNYMLFGAIMDYYDEHKPDGEIMKFKELVSSILGCEVKDAIPEMNALLQRILPLRPLRDCGFTEADFKAFPLSVEANQQRLMTNAYYPFRPGVRRGHLPQVLLKFFPDNEGRDGSCCLSFFPFATRFLSSIHRTFLCIFVQYTQNIMKSKTFYGRSF
mgnify:CR=1 FL=1